MLVVQLFVLAWLIDENMVLSFGFTFLIEVLK